MALLRNMPSTFWYNVHNIIVCILSILASKQQCDHNMTENYTFALDKNGCHGASQIALLIVTQHIFFLVWLCCWMTVVYEKVGLPTSILKTNSPQILDFCIFILNYITKPSGGSWPRSRRSLGCIYSKDMRKNQESRGINMFLAPEYVESSPAVWFPPLRRQAYTLECDVLQNVYRPLAAWLAGCWLLNIY